MNTSVVTSNMVTMANSSPKEDRSIDREEYERNRRQLIWEKEKVGRIHNSTTHDGMDKTRMSHPDYLTEMRKQRNLLSENGSTYNGSSPRNPRISLDLSHSKNLTVF